LETVIFDDGTAIGRDATNAVAQAKGYLDAERQVSDLVSQTIAAGGDLVQLLTGLMPAQPKSRTYQGSSPPGYDDTLRRHRQTVSSLLLRGIQLGNPDPVETFHRNVGAKRHLNIVLQ